MLTLILSALLQAPWRRFRRNLLPLAELTAQPDLTVGEYRLLLALQEEQRAYDARQRAARVFG